MYTIKVHYTTGSSFNTEEATEVIGLVWKSEELVKKALKTLEEHYKLYVEMDNCNSSWRETRTQDTIVKDIKSKEWYKKSIDPTADYQGMVQYQCAVECDDGEWRSLPTCMWCGYFETLHSAEIVIDDSDWKVTF